MLICLILAPLVMTVHPDRIIRGDADRFFGINLNYIRDRDQNRVGARPLSTALLDMGTRWLRFPGGEKSNFHLWSEAPFLKPAPRSLGWYATVKGQRMDFDAYVRLVREVHAEPYVVVACDTKSRTGRTEAEELETAVAWVRYAKVKGYRIRYWEIGNENWNNHKASPAEMGRIVAEFSKAMKAADPFIKTGASGDNDRWWKDFLPIAGPTIDFLSVSQYTGWQWGSYDGFLNGPRLTESADSAVAAIDRYAASADRTRLRVIVAEANSVDFSKNPWPNSNNLGHALVTFSTLGHLALQPRIQAAMVWTTRWMEQEPASSTQFYALGRRNELMPTGEAVKAWGKFVLPEMVECEGSDATTEVFGARTKDGRNMTVWLLNRANVKREIRLNVEGLKNTVLHAYRFAGESPDDPAPTWQMLPDAKMQGTMVDEHELPPLSLTVLTILSGGIAKS